MFEELGRFIGYHINLLCAYDVMVDGTLRDVNLEGGYLEVVHEKRTALVAFQHVIAFQYDEEPHGNE